MDQMQLERPLYSPYPAGIHTEGAKNGLDPACSEQIRRESARTPVSPPITGTGHNDKLGMARLHLYLIQRLRQEGPLFKGNLSYMNTVFIFALG